MGNWILTGASNICIIQDNGDGIVILNHSSLVVVPYFYLFRKCLRYTVSSFQRWVGGGGFISEGWNRGAPLYTGGVCYFRGLE